MSHTRAPHYSCVSLDTTIPHHQLGKSTSFETLALFPCQVPRPISQREILNLNVCLRQQDYIT